MKKEIYTEKAPKPIGPYSQGMLVDNTLYTAGQIAIIPQTGEILTGDLRKETDLVMNHLKSILEEADMNFSNAVKCSIFLSDMAHFGTVNEVYGSYFEKPYPVRETVAVKTLPKNVNVEISLVAVK